MRAPEAGSVPGLQELVAYLELLAYAHRVEGMIERKGPANPTKASISSAIPSEPSSKKRRHPHRYTFCNGFDDAVMTAVGHKPTCRLIRSVSCS